VASRRSPAVGVPPGDVRISAVLQPSESDQDSRVDPLAPPTAGQIPYLDTVQLLNAWPFPPEQLYDGYAVLTAQLPAASPAPEPVPPREFHGGVARWRNLAYALQWWLFAGAAVFFWWAVIRRSATERDPDDDSEAATGSDVPAGTLG
jgi:cytochrome oxidase assembly protein ShyY1